MIAAMDETPTGPHAVAAGQGWTYHFAELGIDFDVKVGEQRPGRRLAVFELATRPGEEPPVHTHATEDEFFYVLDGSFEIRIGDDVHVLGPGGSAYVPRGTVHAFRNAGDTAGRLLVGFTPAGMDEFLREAGRPAADDGPAPPVDDDEIARTIAAAARHGVELVGPAE